MRLKGLPPHRARRKVVSRIPSAVIAVLLPGLAGPLCSSVLLQPETIAAFDEYASAAEQQFSRRLAGAAPFLWSSELDERIAALRAGKVVVEPIASHGNAPIPGGLIHDWIASVLVPNADVEQVVGVVTGYDSHAETYAPSVLESKILSRDGPKLHVAMRMVRSAGLTAVLETEHDAEYDRLGEGRWWGRSRSTSIREVHKVGSPDEWLSPVGNDNGYLWRLHTYWRFAEAYGGVVAEYRTVTLTRGIPSSLRWMLRPVLSQLPKTSLRGVMRTTREAAMARAR